jgi:hypothetical protein
MQSFLRFYVLNVTVACPDYPAARKARAMLLSIGLVYNLAAVVLPCAVCVVVLLLMRLGMMRADAVSAETARPQIT